MRRLIHMIAFRLRQYAWIVLAHLRTLCWKLLGMKVGAGTLLPRIRVTWPHQISLGERCKLEHGISLNFDGSWLPGPAIVIGDDVWIGAGCEFNIHEKIVIGSHSMIAAGCRFIDSDHGYSDRAIPMRQQVGQKSPILIHEDVWLGANAVVLKGVTIGRGAIVGAGAIVTKSIPEYEIWAGVPARKLGVRPASA